MGGPRARSATSALSNVGGDEDVAFSFSVRLGNLPLDNTLFRIPKLSTGKGGCKIMHLDSSQVP